MSNSVLDGPPPPPHDLMIVADYADTLDALPLELTRGFSDLRELDAVLSSSLIHLTDSIKVLTGKVLDPGSTPLDRLTALREVAEFAQRFKLGGEDKIRVVGGVCEGVISHQTHLNNLLLNSTLLTQRPSSPPGGSNIVYLPPTTSGKRTRTGANTSLATPARKETKRKVANPDGGGRGGKRDRETTELLDEWYDSSSHKQSPGKGAPSGSARARVDGPSKKKSHQARPASPALSSTSFDPHNPASTSHASPRFDPARPSRFKDDPILPPSSSSAFQQSVAGGSNTHGPMDPSQASLGPGFEGASSYGDDKQRARARTNTGGAASPMPDDESRTGGAGRPVRRPANSTATHDERGRQFETESEDESEDDEDASRGPGGGPEGGVGAGVGGAGGAGDGEGGDQAKYCYCKGASYGEMIGCDDDDCLIEWYHLDCLELTAPPDGTWHCPTCTKRRADKAAQRAAARAASKAGRGGRGR